MRTYFLREPLGSRTLVAADFPLTVGGPGAAVLVPGLPAGTVAALVGLADGEPFVQPAGGAALRYGTDPLTESTWLHDGDRFAIADARFRVDSAGDDWTLTVEHEGGANETEPPLYEGVPLIEAGEETPARQALQAIAFEAPAASAAARRAPAFARRIGARRLASYAIAASFALVLAFLFLASPVTVQVAPDLEPDRVDFAGAVDVGAGSWHLVMPGEYQLRVAKQGYVPATRKIAVTRESNQRIVVPLAKLPGRLTIDSGGVAATVTADGREVGKVPGTVELPAGPHLLAIAAPRYQTLEQRVQIEGLGREQQLQVALVPGYAPVTFESRPAGARVLVDGKPVGITPATIDVDAGRRAVALAHPEFRTWEQTITVQSAKPQTVGPVELGLPEA